LTERLAGVRGIGPFLQRIAKPAADLSKGCCEDDIINVTSITALQSAGSRFASDFHRTFSNDALHSQKFQNILKSSGKFANVAEHLKKSQNNRQSRAIFEKVPLLSKMFRYF